GILRHSFLLETFTSLPKPSFKRVTAKSGNQVPTMMTVIDNNTQFSASTVSIASSSNKISLTLPSKLERVASINKLTRLITDQQWEQVDRFLSSQSHDQFPSFLDCENEVLHFACAKNAPLSIIRSLCQIYSRSIFTSDSKGRFPLHEAARCGAHPDVIDYLSSTNGSAAVKQDSLGKTPMHYVADSYEKQYRDRIRRGEIKPSDDTDGVMLRVVRVFRDVAPQSFNMEDNRGKCPIEYAIENNADFVIFLNIHRACRDDWSRRGENIKGEKITANGDLLAFRKFENLYSDI
ncbi:hypothetical protein ACHAXS_007663, partial [Conticribra weissflogii]